MKAAAPPASLDGVLNVCKPVGMTSHDVVDAVRRLARTRRVGHAGTLDPGASGVLVLALEHATRIAEFLANADKEYRVEITFGRSTDSGDAYGRTVHETPSVLRTAQQVTAVLPRFAGDIPHSPPMAPAVHVGGRPPYEQRRARAAGPGPPRPVPTHPL